MALIFSLSVECGFKPVADAFVRYFDGDRLKDKLRITIGTAEDNNKLLSALSDIYSNEAV